MATEKIDMSLDDIIKLNQPGRGRGRGMRGGRRGGRMRGRGLRGARGTGSFRGRGFGRGTRFGTRGRGLGGVIRGGVQKRRGFRQSAFGRSQVEGVWQHDMYQEAAGFQQRSGAGGAGDASGRIGKLLIANLEFGVNDADIKELFSEFGTLRKASVHYDRSGRSLGTAEVTYASRQDAIKAMKQYDNVPLDGRPMKIQLVGGAPPVPVTARISNVPRGGSMRGRGGFRGRGRGFGGRRGRGAGRGGRGGANKTPTKDELDAQLDAYNAKMDTF